MPEKKPTSYGRSKTGVELTEATLDRMAAEAEAGLDVAKLRPRRGRPTMGSSAAGTLPVRLEPELRQALDARAAADDKSVSEIVREALRKYLKVS
jgi:predicted HicB family RNase H-like nuclease